MDFSASTDAAAIEWIVPDFILSWRDASCDWTLRPYRRTFASGEITTLRAGAGYGFVMVAPATELASLTFDFAGPMRAAGLWVELRGAEGTGLRRAFIEAAAISGYGQAPVMDLTGLRFDVGAKLLVRLEVVGIDDDAEVYVAATPQPAAGLAFHRRMERLRNERLFVHDRAQAIASGNVVVFAQGASLAETRPALQLLAWAFPGEAFTGVYADKASELWPMVESAKVVAFADVHQAATAITDYDRLCFELNRRGVCTLAVDTQTSALSPLKDGPVARAVKAAIEDQQRCRFILRSEPTPVLCGADQPLEPLPGAPTLNRADSLSSLRREVQAAMTPKVAIVSPLDDHEGAVEAFLEHIGRQTYPGEIVTVLVEGASPGPGAGLAEAFQARLDATGRRNRVVRVLPNPSRLGERLSIAHGVKSEEADIYLVMDGRSLVGPHFVASHVFEHAEPGAEVVIGPLDIDPGDRDPTEVLRELEQDSAGIDGEWTGPVVQADVIDARRGHFSIKRQAIPPAGLFDDDDAGDPPGQAAVPWAQVEAAYRLYVGGARVRVADRAFAVRPRRVTPAPEPDEVRAALRAFDRLLVRNEDLDLVARRWAVDAFDGLVSLADEVGAGDARARLEARFAATRQWQAPLIAVMRGETRRLRVLSYRWHAPHQYELYKLPHDFTLATAVGENGMVERWAYEQRPLRANARLTPASQIDPADYDVALLHFDENVLAPELCNNTIPAAWGDPFQWLLQTDLPKVAICHGTPQFVGQYGADSRRKAAFDLHEDERVRLVALLAAARVHVICNSHQAQAEWGFASSQVIWHGFDPQEFPEGRGDLDVLALDADPHRPHYRGAWEQLEVEARLDPAIRIDNARHFGGALEVRGTNPYARARFRAYAERIGRFKAYLNTTLRSPMPRSRGEAMMTGAVPVCLDNHDVSRFIENGVDGFHADEPAALADFLNHLCRNEGEARRMRAAARRKALDVFNHDRYLTAWAGLLETVAR